MAPLVILSNQAHRQLFEDRGGFLPQDLDVSLIAYNLSLMPKNKGVVSSRQVATTLLQVLGLPLSQLDGCHNEVTPSLPLLFSVISSLKLNRLVDMGRSRRPRERNGLRSGSYLALSLETKSGFCTNLESCGSRGIAYLNLHYHNQYPRKI
jgi:hypothetical protein